MSGRKIAAIAIAAAIFMAAFVWLMRTDRQAEQLVAESTASTQAPRIGAGGKLAVARKRGPYRSHPELTDYTAEEAHAYALLGQLDDGTIAALPPLPDPVAVELDPMRSLLDEDRPMPGEGRTVVTPRGSFTIARKRSDERLGPPAGAAGSTTAAQGQAPKQADVAAMSGSIALTPEGQVITGRDVWAAIRFDPSVQQSVRLMDRGEGGYVFCLRGDNFGSVRVNGGLVVPGRYYLIDSQTVISSMSALGIEICPLVATWSYYPPPMPPPRVNG